MPPVRSKGQDLLLDSFPRALSQQKARTTPPPAKVLLIELVMPGLHTEHPKVACLNQIMHPNSSSSVPCLCYVLVRWGQSALVARLPFADGGQLRQLERTSHSPPSAQKTKPILEPLPKGPTLIEARAERKEQERALPLF